MHNSNVPSTFWIWPLLWGLSPRALPHGQVPFLWLQGSFQGNTAIIDEENFIITCLAMS